MRTNDRTVSRLRHPESNEDTARGEDTTFCVVLSGTWSFFFEESYVEQHEKQKEKHADRVRAPKERLTLVHITIFVFWYVDQVVQYVRIFFLDAWIIYFKSVYLDTYHSEHRGEYISMLANIYSWFTLDNYASAFKPILILIRIELNLIENELD